MTRKNGPSMKISCKTKVTTKISMKMDKMTTLLGPIMDLATSSSTFMSSDMVHTKATTNNCMGLPSPTQESHCFTLDTTATLTIQLQNLIPQYQLEAFKEDNLLSSILDVIMCRAFSTNLKR